MKRTKFFAFLLRCMSAFIFASCLNDDTPDTGLTDAQRQQCLNSIKGDYDGDLIFLSQNPTVTTDKTDTLDIAWKVSAIDTTLTNGPRRAAGKLVRTGAIAGRGSGPQAAPPEAGQPAGVAGGTGTAESSAGDNVVVIH